MNIEAPQKITITLPESVYLSLRREAHRQNISLPEFVKRAVQLRPKKSPTENALKGLADLPLEKLLAITKPKICHPDERIDFFS